MDRSRGGRRRAAPRVPLLRLEGRMGDGFPGPTPTDPLYVHWIGPVRRDPETGRIGAALPHLAAAPASQWQAQLGLRVSF